MSTKMEVHAQDTITHSCTGNEFEMIEFTMNRQRIRHLTHRPTGLSVAMRKEGEVWVTSPVKTDAECLLPEHFTGDLLSDDEAMKRIIHNLELVMDAEAIIGNKFKLK